MVDHLGLDIFVCYINTYILLTCWWSFFVVAVAYRNIYRCWLLTVLLVISSSLPSHIARSQPIYWGIYIGMSILCIGHAIDEWLQIQIALCVEELFCESFEALSEVNSNSFQLFNYIVYRKIYPFISLPFTIYFLALSLSLSTRVRILWSICSLPSIASIDRIDSIVHRYDQKTVTKRETSMNRFFPLTALEVDKQNIYVRDLTRFSLGNWVERISQESI